MKAWRISNQKLAAKISEVQLNKWLTAEQKAETIQKLRTQRISKRQASVGGKLVSTPSPLLLKMMVRGNVAAKEIIDELDT